MCFVLTVISISGYVNACSSHYACNARLDRDIQSPDWGCITSYLYRPTPWIRMKHNGWHVPNVRNNESSLIWITLLLRIYLAFGLLLGNETNKKGISKRGVRLLGWDRGWFGYQTSIFHDMLVLLKGSNTCQLSHSSMGLRLCYAIGVSCALIGLFKCAYLSLYQAAPLFQQFQNNQFWGLHHSLQWVSLLIVLFMDILE